MITIRRCMAADQSAAEQKKDNKYAGETPAPPRGREQKGEYTVRQIPGKE